MSEVKIALLSPEALDDARRVLEQACEFDRAQQVAQEKLFADGADICAARPLGATLDGELVGVAACSGKWIRLLAVHPRVRGRGVGSTLLRACLHQIAGHGNEARTMDQPGNYLSPGIDNRNLETIAWLARRGFQKASKACNLIIALEGNSKVSAECFAQRERDLQNAGYSIRVMRSEELDTMTSMVCANFSRGWAFELGRASQRPGAVHLAVHDSSHAVVGFAVHDGNNQGLGCFGPTATLPPHRGKGLGAALLLASLLDIRSQGHQRGEVAWIGPREFYDKIAGIESERHFTVMTKKLSDEDKR